MKSSLFILLCITMLSIGCTKKDSTTNEVKFDSSSLAAANHNETKATPFCLHVRYRNNYYYLYSENYAEGWITDGACSLNGPRRSIQNIGLGWRYRGQSQDNKQCTNVDSCSFSEKNYGIGKTIECSASTARDGNQSAHATTDPVACR